jgi:integrase/ribosomal protein L40E
MADLKSIYVNKVINDGIFTKEQSETLKKYYVEFSSGSFPRVRSSRTINLIFSIIKLHTIWLNNTYKKQSYLDVTEQELKEYFAAMKETGMRKPNKDSTLITTKAYVKQFYDWLGKKDITSWIKTIRQKRIIDETKLLTYDDVKKLIEATDSPRDKAIISLMYDGALRAGEISNLNVGDIKIDEYGAKITVNGKTGKRTIRLIDSVPYLQQLLNTHPDKKNTNAPLFISHQNQNYMGRIVPKNFCRIVSIISKKAGIKKHIHPHLFRHSKLDQLGKESILNERDMRFFAGWSSTSSMPNTYLHYGEEQVGDKLLKSRGIIKKDKEDDFKIIQPKICPRCDKTNPSDAKYCNCGMALDLKQVIKDTERREQADNKLNEMFADEGFRELVKEYLKKKQEV